MSRKDHRWDYRVVSWVVCSHCGLILLRNRATDRARNKPCPGADQ